DRRSGRVETSLISGGVAKMRLTRWLTHPSRAILVALVTLAAHGPRLAAQRAPSPGQAADAVRERRESAPVRLLGRRMGGAHAGRPARRAQQRAADRRR